MQLDENQRVILWGDSLGKGVVWNEARGRYGCATVNAVQVAQEALHIRIENRSRFGFTATQGLQLMKRDLSEGMRADLAIVEYGGNDCNYDWAAISDAPQQQHDPATLPEDFLDSLRSMVTMLRSQGIKPVLLTLPPIHAQRYFRFLVGDKLNGGNILRWLGDVEHIYRFQELYSGLIAQVARELDVRLIDLRARCLAVPDFVTRLVCADGLHINEDGQRFAGRAIAELALQA